MQRQQSIPVGAVFTFLHMPEKLTPRIVRCGCSLIGWTVLRWPPSGIHARETTGAGVPACEAERSPSRSATFALAPSLLSWSGGIGWRHQISARILIFNQRRRVRAQNAATPRRSSVPDLPRQPAAGRAKGASTTPVRGEEGLSTCEGPSRTIVAPRMVLRDGLSAKRLQGHLRTNGGGSDFWAECEIDPSQRVPRPRAMIPRRISRVPPRKDQLGALSVMLASTEA